MMNYCFYEPSENRIVCKHSTVFIHVIKMDMEERMSVRDIYRTVSGYLQIKIYIRTGIPPVRETHTRILPEVLHFSDNTHTFQIKINSVIIPPKRIEKYNA